jgi:hypothetical protein
VVPSALVSPEADAFRRLLANGKNGMTFITDPVHVGMINYGAVRATPRGKQIRAASHGSVCSSSAHGHRRPSSPVPRPPDAASHGVASCTGGCGDDSSLWQAAAVKGCSLSILGYAHWQCMIIGPQQTHIGEFMYSVSIYVPDNWPEVRHPLTAFAFPIRSSTALHAFSWLFCVFDGGWRSRRCLPRSSSTCLRLRWPAWVGMVVLT